jgi:hypothetical protein
MRLPVKISVSVRCAAVKKKITNFLNIFSYLNLVNKKVDTDLKTTLRLPFGRGIIFFLPSERRSEPNGRRVQVFLFSTQLSIGVSMVTNEPKMLETIRTHSTNSFQ